MTTIPSIQGSNTGIGRFGALGSAGRQRPPAGHGGPPPISREEMDETFRTAAAAQGVDTAKLDSLKDTLREKVKSVVDGGGSATDVQTAIDQVLKDNGIDPETLHEQMQAAAASLGPPPGPPPQQQKNDADQAIDPATRIGTSALLGIDLGRLLAGDTCGVSCDRQA